MQKKQRPVTPDDLKRFSIVSAPQISPDGRQIVFVVKRVGEKNEYVTNLWLVDATGSQPPRQFTSGNKDGRPRWSPDGTQIAFLSAREKHKPQIYVMNAAGGEARPLTEFREGSLGAFTWSPNGKHLAVAYREQDREWTEGAKQHREDHGLSTPPRVIDDWWYRLDGDGYFGAQRFQLYVVDADTGRHRLLYSKDRLGGFDFDWSPDSQEIVVTTNRDKLALIRPWKDELVRINVSTGKLNPLKSAPSGTKSNVRWSPDGKLLAYAGREGGEDGSYGTDNLELWVCDADGENARSLSGAEDYCMLATAIGDASEAEFAPSLQFSPDSKRVFIQLGHHGEMHIASVAVKGGPIAFHTKGNSIYDPGNLSGDGKKFAVTVGDATTLSEIAVLKVTRGEADVKRLTNLNKELLDELEIAKPKSSWVKSADGHRVQVWSILPPRAKAGRKVPAVLEIHGGPHAQYGCSFFHEFQVLAAAGYAVFYSNPRGSKGYGRDHCAAIRGAWGTKDWEDIQAVTKFIQDHPNVNPKKVGVMGGSYGGYMTNWAIGHTDQFAAAISDRCVSNLVSMSGNSDFPLTPDRYFPGNGWDNPEPRWQQSPMAHMGHAKTPTLIIHSEGDLRCNIEQSEQVFAALKLLGVPCRLVRYPSSTSHGMSRMGPPDLRIHRLEQILRWWKEYLG